MTMRKIMMVIALAAACEGPVLDGNDAGGTACVCLDAIGATCVHLEDDGAFCAPRCLDDHDCDAGITCYEGACVEICDVAGADCGYPWVCTATESGDVNVCAPGVIR